jgi:hypothetical protein
VLVKREFESRRSGTWHRALPFAEPVSPRWAALHAFLRIDTQHPEL